MNGYIKKKTYTHFIPPKEEKYFSIAGIWEKWLDKNTGEVRRTASIITTTANSLMAKIHINNIRMPLILPNQTALDWLSSTLTKEYINMMMVPFDDNEMSAHTISRLITSRDENSNVQEFTKEESYSELT